MKKKAQILFEECLTTLVSTKQMPFDGQGHVGSLKGKILGGRRQ